MAKTQITITAADADFHERRRLRIIRRAAHHEHERRVEMLLAGLALAAPVLLGCAVCHLWSLWALGIIG